jgi:hypothetical protein
MVPTTLPSPEHSNTCRKHNRSSIGVVPEVDPYPAIDAPLHKFRPTSRTDGGTPKTKRLFCYLIGTTKRHTFRCTFTYTFRAHGPVSSLSVNCTFPSTTISQIKHHVPLILNIYEAFVFYVLIRSLPDWDCPTVMALVTVMLAVIPHLCSNCI